MEPEEGKLSLGGISWDTTEDTLNTYFSAYGDVLKTAVIRDETTGNPRGFGFVVFADPSVLDTVLEEIHVIDGSMVDVKRALCREERRNAGTARSGNPDRNAGSGGNLRNKKIFVGGLPSDLTEEKFRLYFEAYGRVTHSVIMSDKQTGRSRGFGFISFDSEDVADTVLQNAFHYLNGKRVEVKRTFPKDANPSASGRMGGAGGGGYQGYGTSSGSSNAYDGRLESNRYMQPQGTVSGFPPYGSASHNTPGYGYGYGYGYGPSNYEMGYGGYGNYGGSGVWYVGPAGATYGNPNVQNAGYADSLGAASSRNAPSPTSGYSSMGYGNPAPWGTHSGGTAGSGPAGQSSSGASGYENQSYGYGGYGGYGGGDSSCGNQGAYGAVGGIVSNNPTGTGVSDLQGTSGGYIGSVYGDSTANSGYGSEEWRSDQVQASGYGTPQGSGSHSAQVSYGGGYGGSQEDKPSNSNFDCN